MNAAQARAWIEKHRGHQVTHRGICLTCAKKRRNPNARLSHLHPKTLITIRREIRAEGLTWEQALAEFDRRNRKVRESSGAPHVPGIPTPEPAPEPHRERVESNLRESKEKKIVRVIAEIELEEERVEKILNPAVSPEIALRREAAEARLRCKAEAAERRRAAWEEFDRQRRAARSAAR